MAVTLEWLETRVQSGLHDTRGGAANVELVGILAAAVALVEQWAPTAPEAVRDEATIRLAGWTLERPFAATRREVGDFETEVSAGGYGGMLYSGAAGLLSPWCDPRAVGATS